MPKSNTNTKGYYQQAWDLGTNLVTNDNLNKGANLIGGLAVNYALEQTVSYVFPSFYAFKGESMAGSFFMNNAYQNILKPYGYEDPLADFYNLTSSVFRIPGEKIGGLVMSYWTSSRSDTPVRVQQHNYSIIAKENTLQNKNSQQTKTLRETDDLEELFNVPEARTDKLATKTKETVSKSTLSSFKNSQQHIKSQLKELKEKNIEEQEQQSDNKSTPIKYF